MKLSLKWLTDFFPNLKASGSDVGAKADTLRSTLPFFGIEIGGYKRIGQGIEAVQVAHLLEFQKHPNADKLNVCKVATGKPGEILQIVCGAPNVKAGAKVALAPVGCELPGGLKIKQAAIRGVDSFGMLCSEKELGLSDESNGIMLLPESAPVGSPVVKALGLADEVWEIELTPDRADCLSHYGMAREMARFLNEKPALPEHDELVAGSDVPVVNVEVQSSKLCPVYGAQLFEGATNAQTPEWMKRTLDRLGLRSHGAIVDITNFVLMELGHPLHAFDADKIVGSKIIVRNAKAGEKLVTLDGEARTLHADDLVIADAEKPLALAGVMGGLDSGVTANTKRVLLESAVFDMNAIRATAKRHRIHSDASHRFERGVDAAGVVRAAGRASLLIRQITGARRRGAYVEIRSDKAEKLFAKHSINFNLRTYKDVVGVDAGADELIRAFHSVGIEAQTKSPNVIRVDVPTHRLDLVREIDLVEEAARLLGYDKIPARYPDQHERTHAVTGGVVAKVRRVRHRLVETGLTEMMPYAFVSAEQLKAVPNVKAVELQNPLSAEWSHLRPSLSFGLLEVLKRHVALGQPEGGFFDSGSVFETSAAGDVQATTDKPTRSTGCREAFHAGWALSGHRLEEHWSSDKKSADRKAFVDVFDAKGVAERVMDGLVALDGRWKGAQFVALGEALENPAFAKAWTGEAAWIPTALLHPGRSALIVLPGPPPGVVVGYVGELHPAHKRDLLNLPAGLAIGAVLGEVRVMTDLTGALEAKEAENALGRGKIRLSRMLPVVDRDLAVVVSGDTKAGDIDRALRKTLGGELIDLQCVDRFDLGGGRVSLAWRFRFQGVEATLTDAQIQGFVDKALGELKQKFSAEIRT